MLKKNICRAIGSSVLLFSSYASADLCRNPTVHIHNESNDDVDVTAIRYWDDCDRTWRRENVPRTEIEDGQDEAFDDDLEYVQGCVITAFQVLHRHGNGSYFWSPDLFPDVADMECDGNAHYDIHLE